MFHETAKTLYQEYHKMGYTTELALVGGEDGPYPGRSYIMTVIANLFDRKTRQPVVGLVFSAGDLSKPEDPDPMYDYVLNELNLYQDDISFGEVAGIMGATKSMMNKILGQKVKDLFEKEALLNLHNCAISDIRISDMSDVLDGISGDMTPEVEYNMMVGTLGKVRLHFNEDTVSQGTGEMDPLGLDSNIFSDMIGMANGELKEENQTAIELAGRLTMAYKEALENTVAGAMGEVIVPFVKNDIMAYFQVAIAVTPEKKG